MCLVYSQSPCHVYDHGTTWTSTVNTYFSFSFKYRLLLPLVCQFQVCSTKSNRPILLFVVVRYYHSQPFLMVLDTNICCGGYLYPNVSLGIPCTLSSRSVSYLGQTFFHYKTFATFWCSSHYLIFILNLNNIKSLSTKNWTGCKIRLILFLIFLQFFHIISNFNKKIL